MVPRAATSSLCTNGKRAGPSSLFQMLAARRSARCRAWRRGVVPLPPPPDKGVRGGAVWGGEKEGGGGGPPPPPIAAPLRVHFGEADLHFLGDVGRQVRQRRQAREVAQRGAVLMM